MARERRRHVRVRPAPDFDLRVSQAERPLLVVDVSLTGLGLLVSGTTSAWKIGDRVEVLVELPGATGFVAELTVRHKAAFENGVCGCELTEFSEVGRLALKRYVGALFGRGHSA